MSDFQVKIAVEKVWYDEDVKAGVFRSIIFDGEPDDDEIVRWLVVDIIENEDLEGLRKFTRKRLVDLGMIDKMKMSFTAAWNQVIRNMAIKEMEAR